MLTEARFPHARHGTEGRHGDRGALVVRCRGQGQCRVSRRPHGQLAAGTTGWVVDGLVIHDMGCRRAAIQLHADLQLSERGEGGLVHALSDTIPCLENFFKFIVRTSECELGKIVEKII